LGKAALEARWESPWATGSACWNTPGYSVISPEGCAGILWKTGTPENTQLAADAIKLTSRDLAQLGVIDEIIPEPPGGAHRDSRETATH